MHSGATSYRLSFTPVLSCRGPGGTTVQLPSFRFFTVNTSVLVPDAGRAVLGGIGSSGTVGRSAGPGGGRTLGGAGGAQMMDVHAKIHDMQAMDEALLNSARQATGGMVGSGQAVVRRTTDQPGMSVAEARALHAAEADAQQNEARKYLERGRQAIADGKSGVAKILLEMAQRRATGELQNEIAADLEKLNAPATATKQE